MSLNNYEQFLDYIFTNCTSLDVDITCECFNFNELSRNPYVSWNLVSLHPQLEWNFDFLSCNPSITFSVIQNNSSYPWNPKYYSMNPNITIQIINDNPGIEWDWDSISQNANLIWPTIESNLDKPWNWDILTRTIYPKVNTVVNVPVTGDRLLVVPNKHLQLAPGAGRIIAPKIQIGNTTAYDLPLEIGSSSLTHPPAEYGFMNSVGGIGENNDSIIANYSLRTTGRILCSDEIDIVSDRREKECIAPLDDQHCRDFISNVQPMSYRYKNNNKTHYGYIAQDVYKAGFSNLVSLMPSDDMMEAIDTDGFKSPRDTKFVLCYDEIIPILSKNIELLYEENKELKRRIELLENK